MNKKERKEMQAKIDSVNETVKILKLQESNLIEAIRLHHEDHPKQEQWVRELFIGADYIVRLEHSVKLMEETLSQGRKSDGKKAD